MRYLHNCWYMAAWGEELPHGQALARRLLDEAIVLYRDAEGAIHALRDRCPHRFAPLSKGGVEGANIVCGYHGLAFDGTGACVANPHGPVTQKLVVRAYPVHEAYRALWIWMGEPARADSRLIPDLEFLATAPDTAFSKGHLQGKGHYQLWVDNILDLTHADYLHPGTLGGGSFTRTRAKVAEHDGAISVHWHCMNEVPTPVMRSLVEVGQRVDSWTEVAWYAPGVMTLVSGAVPAGTPREAGGNVRNVHIMTPESDRSTHYFFASTRDFAVADAALNARFGETRRQIFSTEDMPMIAGQFDRMEGEDFWSLGPNLLRIDEGAARARRKLDQMISDEERTAAESSRASAVMGPLLAGR